jgi:diguanylate cyclase (GGDEF)-like protein
MTTIARVTATPTSTPRLAARTARVAEPPRILVLPCTVPVPTLNAAAERLGVHLVVADDAGHARTLAFSHSFCAVIAEDAATGQPQLGLLADVYALQPSTVLVLTKAESEAVRLPPGAALSAAVAGTLRTNASLDEALAVMRGAILLSRARTPSLPEERRTPAALRVLLVGGVPTQQLLQQLLKDQGARFKLRRAATLEAALTAIGGAPPDLVLAELELRDGRGLDVVARLVRASTKGPTVVLLGQEDPALSSCTLALGAQDVLVQSRLDAAGLRRALRNAVVRHQVSLQLMLRSVHDELTGLAKRALFHQRVASALARSRRGTGCCAVVYVDLDRFKRINDTWGHAAGDQVLLAVSQRLRAAVREYDTVARLGGDEFAILLDDLDGPGEAETVTQRVAKALAPPIVVQGQGLQVTASMGIGIAVGGEDTVDALLRRADAAMYEAKRAGRNTYSLAPALSVSNVAPRTTPRPAARASGVRRRVAR